MINKDYFVPGYTISIWSFRYSTIYIYECNFIHRYHSKSTKSTRRQYIIVKSSFSLSLKLYVHVSDVYTYFSFCGRVCMCLYVCTSVHVYMCTCMCMSVCECVWMCVCVYVCLRVRACARAWRVAVCVCWFFTLFLLSIFVQR